MRRIRRKILSERSEKSYQPEKWSRVKWLILIRRLVFTVPLIICFIYLRMDFLQESILFENWLIGWGNIRYQSQRYIRSFRLLIFVYYAVNAIKRIVTACRHPNLYFSQNNSPADLINCANILFFAPIWLEGFHMHRIKYLNFHMVPLKILDFFGLK